MGPAPIPDIHRLLSCGKVDIVEVDHETLGYRFQLSVINIDVIGGIVGETRPMVHRPGRDRIARLCSGIAFRCHIDALFSCFNESDHSVLIVSGGLD